MIKYNRDAFVVMAQCNKTKQCIGVTFNPINSRLYRIMWSFKIKEDTARKEKYDKKSVNGNIDVDVDFQGCPYCGAKQFYFCGKCGKMVCYDGVSEIATCPNCNNQSTLQVADNFHIEGGGF